MKRIYLTGILVTALVLTGCTVSKDIEFEPVDNSGHTLIEADIETLIFEEVDRVWPEDAYIGVYGSEQGDNERYTLKDASAGLRTATFYGPLVKGDIAAYYPYSPSYIGNADGMPSSLSSVQSYDPEADAVSHFLEYTPYAYGYMQAGRMTFVYPNGLLRVTVATAEVLSVNEIVISSETDRLAGLGIFRSNGTLAMTEGSDTRIVLDCGDGVLSRDADGLTEFYIVLVPGIYEGLEISIGIVGEQPFSRILPLLEVERAGAGDFSLTSVEISISGPDGFIDTPVEFE